jgi:hypothetical protein
MRVAGDQNLLVLTFYIIGISYTFNRMIESIADKIKFEFDKEEIAKQLAEQNLKDDVGISFKFQPTSGIDDVKDLSITVENKSKNLALYIDWDNCSLVVKHFKASKRVIRKSPDVTRDLGVLQSPSLVAPSNSLTTSITSEDTFVWDKDTSTYSTKKPLIDIEALRKHPVKTFRILYNKFMNRRANLEFSLQLVLRTSELRVGLVPGENKPPMCIINCPFTIRKLPWSYALPWNKKR